MTSVFANKRVLKKCLLAIAICAVLILLFYWASGERLFYEQWSSKVPDAQEQITVLQDGSEVSFDIEETCDLLESVSIYIGTIDDKSRGSLIVDVSVPGKGPIASLNTPLKKLTEYSYYSFELNEPFDAADVKKFTITITTKGVSEKQNLSLWSNNSFTTGKYTLSDMNDNYFLLNGKKESGKVCSYISGRNNYLIGRIFWPCAIALLVLFAIYVFNFSARFLAGKESKDTGLYVTCQRYKFLMRQLVSRDFKKKYKRSILGFGWTLLNPLLTMMVQYVVFSTIFKSSIDNFVTYLLTGIVLMGFCTESIGLGLSSIIDNAHLINKVYMPKEIYPLSRVISSVINLLLAMIPLLAVAFISGAPISKALLLLPIDLMLLLLFCYGMVLILSTSMAFFSDTLFLWNVLSTLWMYLTPIFYPVDIIPAQFLTVYKMNPMYQFITFMRTILIDGQAPTPGNYLGCIISAAVVLILGRYVFKKNEDKFILYL